VEYATDLAIRSLTCSKVAIDEVGEQRHGPALHPLCHRVGAESDRRPELLGLVAAMQPGILSSKILTFVAPAGYGGKSRISLQVTVA
jgi:hypothetical protein